MNKYNQVLMPVAFCAAVFLPVKLYAANDLSLAEAPLLVTTTVQPNVMLLLDNSGSMENVVWYPGGVIGGVTYAGYDDSVTYDDWNWNTNTTYTPLNDGNGDCNGDSVRGLRGGNIRCLILPDPEGDSTRYKGNYLNYLFVTFGVNGTANTEDLTASFDAKYQQSRLQTVQTVAKAVTAATNTKMRFGLAKLATLDVGGNNNKGGTVVSACQPNQNLDTAIDALTPSTWTPLSEALYEVTRYFRGLDPFYSAGSFPKWDGTHVSPIEYRCQKNFTIVLTDGLPTYDMEFPGSADDDDIPTGRSVQNWDENSANDGPQGTSDGDQQDEGNSLYLDDIAKFAWDTDFKTAADGNDVTSVSYQDPAFEKQNMHTYTVGFAVDNQMLQHAAEGLPAVDGVSAAVPYGHGHYYTATDSDGLTDALLAAFADIAKKTGSSSSAAANTGRVQSGSRAYQARFNSTDWSGQLLAFEIESDATEAAYGDVLTDGAGPSGSEFDAGESIPDWDSRIIITNKLDTSVSPSVETGYRFSWDQFTAAEKTAYFDDQEAVLEYLRGRNDSAVSAYRARTSILGDIVSSSPYFVGKPSARYPETWGVTGKRYSDFKDSFATTPRQNLLYVGANDGMLHAFDADTGVEKMAYIPGSVLPKLKALADPDYAHDFYVDGSPTVVDAYDATTAAWKTVLIGGLNKGGQAIYALDITNPSTFSEANANSIFMWEFTDQEDADLGYTYSRPKIVKLQDGQWYAIFGNGYNSTETDGQASSSGDAVIYIVNLFDGTLKKKISTNVGVAEDPANASRPNGFATVTPVDVDGDQVADFVYGGDLFGNVWKFTLDSSSSVDWALDYKLFSACSANTCTSSNVQPITTPVTIGRPKYGTDPMVYFGTGKYLETTDNNGSLGGIQSFYAIHDEGAVVLRSALLQQSILDESSVTVTNKNGTPNDASDDYSEDVPLRKTSNLYMASHKGWYLDFVPPQGERGERLVSAPALRGGRVLFVTNIPANDPCSPGGDSWLMSLDAFSGGRLINTYDIDNSGSFGAGDRVYTDAGSQIVASGIKVGSGGNAPSFMPGSDTDKAIISGNDQLETYDVYGGDDVNRQSWQQITR
ncbi:pilus assembly protein [Neptunomonas qingdaonensis]|uniref:Type IV pilus assembly protein PilY1 n=1 Tax=Neptunomonas qingdaonensis TaxID=1045558 RepID=A0A1I2VL14_9GAMM|nr:PilC/PilY family type IV pilus protein [Neptunomonas qingdaonensis]SFG89099.1 type IV pilus assembly protein PilY1 [Neptunomonas qingdaonensis]